MNRLAKIENQQATQPIAPARIEAAYQHFVKTGELPTHRRLAATITERALNQNGADAETSDVERCLRELEAMAAGVDLADRYDDDKKVRRQLFGEAVHGDGVVQDAARGILKVFAKLGIDLTEPLPHEASFEFYQFGSLGLDLLGWPECLIRAPYEKRASKLLARLEAVRSRIHELPNWQTQFDDAVAEFYVTGALPANATIREAVLCNRELSELTCDVIAADEGRIC